MKYLLDTNVLSEISRPNPNANVKAWYQTVNDSDLAISAMTVREICKGIERLRCKKPEVAKELAAQTDAVFMAFDERILPINTVVAASWGEMLAESEKHIDDTGIAATARCHSLVLVTRNVKDFAGRHVSVLDPFKSPPSLHPPF